MKRMHIQKTKLKLSTMLIVVCSLFTMTQLVGSQASIAAPSNPIDLTAIAVDTQEVDLTWSLTAGSISGIASFQIRRNGTSLVTVDPATFTYTDTAVQPAKLYLYTVEALDAAGKRLAISRPDLARTPRLPDTTDRTPPSEPEELYATAYKGYNLLDWYYSIDDSDITAFLIRRNGRRLALVRTGTLTYVDTRIQPGVSYTYTVESIDVVGHHSPTSDPATVTTLAQAAPLTLAASNLFSQAANAFAMPALAAPANVAAAAFSAQLRRYPYLTDLVGPYVTINWATDSSSSTGSVKWGQVATDGSCNPTTSVSATKNNITVVAATEFQWKAALTLSADTQYCYRVYQSATDLLGADAAPRFWTQVPAGSSQSFTFDVFGDWGAVDATGVNDDQANLMHQIATSGARFAITTGDQAYPSGSQTNYGDLTQTGADTSAIFGPAFWTVAGASIPLFPIIGNHGLKRSDTNHPHLINWPQDRAVAGSSGKYVKETYCCVNGSASEVYPSAWYAFDAGNARFYMLDAAWADANLGTAPSIYKNDHDAHWLPGNPEYEWLKSDLLAHPNALKFAFFHYPLYSGNKSESSNTYLQGPSELEGLLASNGVAMAFNGHAHLYQRTAKLNSSTLVTYLAGGGGAKLEPLDGTCSTNTVYAIGWSYSANGGAGGGSSCGSSAPPKPASRAQVFHFLRVTINGSQVTVAPTDSQGHTFDVQTYTFGSGATATPTDTPLATNTPTSTPAVTSTPTSTSTSTPLATNTPTAGSATTLTFATEADAYVDQTSATSNFGSNVQLMTDNSPVQQSYMRFTVSGVSGSVQSAKLRVFVTDGTTNGPQVFASATGWAENTITWNTQPGPSGSASDDLGSISTSAGWIEFNVTPLVSGNGTVSFVLVPQSSDALRVSSREGANPPQLVVTYAGGAATPTATNTAISTSTPTNTPTDTPLATSTPTDTPLATSTPTNTPLATSTPTNTPLATNTPTNTPLATSTPTNTPLATSTPTNTPLATSTPTNTPTSGTPIFSDGFESGNLAAWTTNGGLTVQSVTVHNGGFAAQGNTTNGGTYAKKNLPSSYTNGYGRIYFNLLSFTSQVNLLRFRTAADGSIAYLYVDTAGKLNLRNDAGALTYTSSTTVGSGWHSLELHATINGTSSITEVWLDGTPISALSVTTNLGTTAIGRFQIGEVQTGRTYNVVFDDAVFNTQRVGP